MPSTPTAPALPMRAAVYLRISQDREMDGLAIERQRQDCEALAAYRKWAVVEIYVDHSKSATDKTKCRPEYDRMVADYQAGRFTAIVCYDLDRLTRQPRQLEDWIDAAETRGLALVTANGDADLGTDGGRMYARIKAAVARAEVERKSARQSRAHVQRAAQGRVPKGVRPLGYATDGTTIEAEAKAVAAMFAAFAAGASLRGIARALSGNPDGLAGGVPHLQRHTRTLVLERNAARAREGLAPRAVPEDAAWPESTVLGVLRNPRHAGFSVYTTVKDRHAAAAANQAAPTGGRSPRGKRRGWREQVVIDEAGQPVRGRWEPTVEEDLWRGVQDRLDDPDRITNRVGTHRRHLGSGLFRCGVCQRPMQGASRGYRCRIQGHLNRTGPAIDDFVTRLVHRRLSGPYALASAAGAPSVRAGEIAAELVSWRARIARAQRDYDEEVIEAADLKRTRDRAGAAIEGLEAERLILGHRAGALPILGTKDPAGTFLAADLGIRREVVDTLCVVTLYPQKQGRKGFNPASVGVVWR